MIKNYVINHVMNRVKNECFVIKRDVVFKN